MKRLATTDIGAWCAILMFPVFIAGGVLMSASGASDLIPGTGQSGGDWLAAVAFDGRFSAGGWLLILMGFLAVVAFVGFYFAMRSAGEALILAPVLGVAGMVLVQVSHLIPMGMAYQLAPAYVEHAAEQPTLGAVSDTFASVSLVLNSAGDAVVWGVAVPLYAWAVLTTGAAPRWVGWLGLLVAVCGGWLGLLAPASGVMEGISGIGFFGFFIFMLSMGIALLRRRGHRPELVPPQSRNDPTPAPL